MITVFSVTMKDFAVTTHKFCTFATLLRPTESMDKGGPGC